MFRVVRAGGDRSSPPLAWAAEKRAELATFELEDSAFSVAQGFCDGGRRDEPPLTPPSKGGEKERGAPSKLGETPRNIRGGKSPLLILQDFNRPPWPPPSQAAETKSEPPFALGFERGTALAHTESEFPAGGASRRRPCAVPKSFRFHAFLTV